MNQFDNLVGQEVPFDRACISADSAMQMDQALETGNSDMAQHLVQSGDCGLLPSTFLGKVQSFIDTTGDVFVMHVVVDGYNLFTHVNQGWVNEISKILGMGV